MKFAESVFKAYDIRGVASRELTTELSHAIGRAFADWLPTDGPVAVGRDMRLDSGEIADAVKAGLVQQGREVWDIGEVTSDMIYFAIGKYKLAGGAMITASHNPGMDDGIKLTREEVRPVGKISGLNEIRKAVEADDFKTVTGTGKVTDKNIEDDWVTHSLGFVDLKRFKNYHVAIDAGNGMAGAILPLVLPQLPLEVTPMFFRPDGRFPNHPANPMDVNNLQSLIHMIQRNKLDFGIAFDGDADRAFFVDELGQPVSGSTLAAILSAHMLKKYPGSTILYNAICGRVVPETIEAGGGKAIRTKVGHPFIVADMNEFKAVFASENAGHYYFRDNYNADSGLIAALVAIEALSESGMKLSQLAEKYQTYYSSTELNYQVDDAGKVVDQLIRRFGDGQVDLLDGLSIFYPDWWFNVRASNTEPTMRLNVEADTEELAKKKTFEVLNILRS